MPATAAAAAAACALMMSRRVSSTAQPPSVWASGSIWWKTSTADSTPATSRIRSSRSTMPPELSVSSVTTILPRVAGAVDLDAVERGQSRAHRRQRGRPGVDEQARDVQLSRHGATPRGGDVDGRDGAWGDAFAAAGAGREVDLRLRHAAKSGAKPDRTLRAGVAAALADDAAPGEAAVADAGMLGLRAHRGRLRRRAGRVARACAVLPAIRVTAPARRVAPRRAGTSRSGSRSRRPSAPRAPGPGRP